MLMFRELTKEENATVERFHRMKGRIAELEIKKLEKRKEMEYFQQKKDMDYVPVIVWGLLLLSQLFLLFLDLFFGWWSAGFTWAIIMVSMTPVLVIFFGFFFIKTLRTYILKNSKSSKYMEIAMKKGIENRWLRMAELTNDFNQINAELRTMKKEHNYLKLEVEKIEASQYM